MTVNPGGGSALRGWLWVLIIVVGIALLCFGDRIGWEW